MVDTADHFGELQPLNLTQAGGTFSGTLPALSFSRLVFPLTAPTDSTPPAAPTGVTAIHLNGAIVLDWDDSPAGDLHEYRIHRSTIAGRDHRVLDMNVSASAYTDTDVVTGVDYYYLVEAVDTSGNVSLASTEAAGRMPVYEPVFSTDFQLSQPDETTTAANLNLSTIGGHWAGGLPSDASLRRDNPPEPGFYHVVQQALLLDQIAGGFTAKAIFDTSVPIDGLEVNVDVRTRRFGNAAKNIKIEGRDSSGNTSFELLLQMTDRRLGYVHSGTTETVFPEGSNGDIEYNGDTYDPPLDNLRLILSSTGYSVEYDYGKWISAEVPYNGSATTIDRILISATTAQAGIWIDNLRVRRILPPDDGSNTAPVFSSDPLTVPAIEHDQFFTSTIAPQASDADGDGLLFSRVAGPAWLHIRSDGTLHGTPEFGDIGLNTIRAKVEDPYGASHIVDLEIPVTQGPNNSPSFNKASFSKSAATETIAYTNTIAGSATDPDPIDVLTYTKTSGPAWLTIALDGTLSGTPANSNLGVNRFNLLVSDGAGGTDTATLKITVKESSILAGWNAFASPNGNPRNANETSNPLIAASLLYSTAGADWKRASANEGSSDLTYGTIPGAPGNDNATTDGLKCKIEDEYIDFTITNNHPSSTISLLSFNFDAWRLSQGSISRWSLRVLGGSDITTGAVSNGDFVKKDGALPVDSDFDDFDVPLTGLADSVLATGESATLRLTMTNTSGSGFTYLDNFALVGALELLPEIEISLPSGAILSDGFSQVDFGETLGAGDSTEIVLTIRNVGEATLSTLAANIDGTLAGDFDAGEIASTELEPTEETNITLTFLPETAGPKTANLQIASDDTDENPFDITLIGSHVEETTLQSWAESFGLSGASLLPSADDDGDLVSLLEEYAYNMNPTLRDNTLLDPGTGTFGTPVIRMVGDGSDLWLQAEYLRRRSDPNLVYGIEFGSDLSEMPPGGFFPATEPESVMVIDEIFHRVIVDDAMSVQSHDRRFGRATVTYPGGAP